MFLSTSSTCNMSQNTSPIIYCDKNVDDFHTTYKNIHGYLSLSICLLGTLANVLNIIVLTRHEMRTPTNAILTGLAVADLAVMLEYMPYAIHDYILTEQWPREQQLNYSWACYIKFHAIYAQLLHTISIWLTVMLAVWRYLAVTYPQVSREKCGMRNTVLAIIFAYILCGVVVTPWLYLVSSVAQFEEVVNDNDKVLHSRPLSEYIVNYQAKHAYTNFSKLSAFSDNSISNSNSNVINSNEPSLERNITVYRLFYSDMALRNNALHLGTLLVYSVLIKLIPCIALTVLSVRLISALLEVKKRRQMLRSQLLKAEEKSTQTKTINTQSQCSSAPDDREGTTVNSSFALRKNIDKAKQTDRTTQMLLAVLLLFLITEFPQGIMGLLNTILGESFFMQCYLKLSDLMDVLALLNSSINFILYCSMSRQFRQTFVLLFCPRYLSRCLLSHRHHHHHQLRFQTHDPYVQNRQQYNHHEQRQHNNEQDNHHPQFNGDGQELPLQEDNFTTVNGILTTDNRSRSAFIEQWFQTTTQVTQV